MPKVKSSIRVKNYVSEFGEHIFSYDDNILFCKMCEIKVNSEKRFTVTQHLKTKKHVRAVYRKNLNESKTQQPIQSNIQEGSIFNKNLCKSLLLANIPLEKLENKHFRSFLEKYTGKNIPSVSLLRKTYVNDCYEDTMNEIRNQIKGKKIWVSIDESNDATGRYIANIVIGILQVDGPGKIFLLESDVLEKINHSTIIKLFDKALFSLWPKGIQHDDVLLFITDATPYMIKAAKSIQVFYSKVIHVTCLARGLYKTSEKIRATFPKVDELITNIKEIFFKAPARIELFKREAPEVPILPVLTCTGMWIIAATYYGEHFNTILNVIKQLDPKDAFIENVKRIMSEEHILETDLEFIYSNYGHLKTAITSLETQGLPLIDSINIIENIKKKFKEISGAKGETIYNTFIQVIEKNNGFQQLSNIAKIITGEKTAMNDLPEDLLSSDLVYFKYAPISLVVVKRNFSQFNMFSDNRPLFLFENLSKELLVNYNSSDNN